jgi:hypothetical protein
MRAEDVFRAERKRISYVFFAVTARPSHIPLPAISPDD